MPGTVVDGLARAGASVTEIGGLLSRLNFINELIWKLSNFSEFGGVRSYLDSIELHAGLCFQLEEGDKYSWYLSQTSWVEGGINVATGSDAGLLLQSLISHGAIVCSDKDELLLWMAEAGSVGDKLLSEIERSTGLPTTLHALISLQSWVALILAKSSAQRLTSWIWK